MDAVGWMSLHRSQKSNTYSVRKDFLNFWQNSYLPERHLPLYMYGQMRSSHVQRPWVLHSVEQRHKPQRDPAQGHLPWLTLGDSPSIHKWSFQVLSNIFSKIATDVDHNSKLFSGTNFMLHLPLTQDNNVNNALPPQRCPAHNSAPVSTLVTPANWAAKTSPHASSSTGSMLIWRPKTLRNFIAFAATSISWVNEMEAHENQDTSALLICCLEYQMPSGYKCLYCEYLCIAFCIVII